MEELILETDGEETQRSHTPGGDSFDPRLSQMSVVPADRHILKEIGRGEILVSATVSPCWQNKDGGLYLAERNTMPMYEDSDSPIGIGGTASDIIGSEQAMREREEQYRSLYRRTPAMLHSIDATGRLIAVSDLWLEVLGFDRSEVLGRKSVEFLTEDSRCYAEETALPRFYETGVARDVSYQFVKKNGEVLDVLLSAIAERDASGNMIRSVAVLVDITEQKLAEDASRQHAERLRVLHEMDRAILENEAPEAIAKTALAHLKEILGFYGASVALFDEEAQLTKLLAVHFRGKTSLGPRMTFPLPGFMKAEGTRMSRVQMIEDLHSLPHEPLTDLLIQEGVRSGMMIPLISRGEPVGCLYVGRETLGGFPSESVSIARDVAGGLAIAIEKASLTKKLFDGRDRLRQVTRQLFSAQEQERQRVSRDLHDEAGQALTALKISLELIKSDFGDQPGELQQRIAEAVSLTEETMEQIRLLARGLRPPELDALGLDAAIESFCRDFSARTQLALDYDGVDLPTLREGVAISLYRILQEALTNVAKHADARRVRVVLLSEDDTVCLTVQDDGRGFDVHAVESSSGRQRGNGIVGMRERLKLIGGALELDPKVGEGTRLVARVPLKEAR